MTQLSLFTRQPASLIAGRSCLSSVRQNAKSGLRFIVQTLREFVGLVVRGQVRAGLVMIGRERRDNLARLRVDDLVTLDVPQRIEPVRLNMKAVCHFASMDPFG